MEETGAVGVAKAGVARVVETGAMGMEEIGAAGVAGVEVVGIVMFAAVLGSSGIFVIRRMNT